MPRPPNPINWTLFEELCSLQCTQSEMASCLKINVDTLRDRSRIQYKEEDYSIIYKKFSEGGHTSLRRFQFNLAKKNTAMAIWLGKQWLGQKDHDEKDTSPKEEDLELKNKYYAALYKMQQIEKELNDLKSKASSELQRSNSCDQSLDRIS